MEPPSLEGWAPEVGPGVTLEEVVERAFDYRGNVTVVGHDGRELTGYLFNRNRDVPEPYVELFDSAGDGPHRLRYADIRTIRFTGRDPAAGGAYAVWLRSRGAAGTAAASGQTTSPPVEGA